MNQNVSYPSLGKSLISSISSQTAYSSLKICQNLRLIIFCFEWNFLQSRTFIAANMNHELIQNVVNKKTMIIMANSVRFEISKPRFEYRISKQEQVE